MPTQASTYTIAQGLEISWFTIILVALIAVAVLSMVFNVRGRREVFVPFAVIIGFVVYTLGATVTLALVFAGVASLNTHSDFFAHLNSLADLQLTAVQITGWNFWACALVLAFLAYILPWVTRRYASVLPTL